MRWFSSHTRGDVELLARYLTGECREREVDEIRARLSVDEAFARLLDELELVWSAVGEAEPGFEVEAFGERFYRRLGQELKVRPLPGASLPRRAVRSARSGVVGVPRRRGRSWAGVGMALVLVVLSVVAVRLTAPSPVAEPVAEPRVLEAGVGQLLSVRLTDGTRVRLGVESRLEVPPDFGEGRRVVQLEGEAFFAVSPDSLQPFVVETRQARVVVHGTCFDVRAYREDAQVQVVVAEGVVSLGDPVLGDTVVLRSRQLGRLRGGRLQAVRRGVDLARYLAWKEGELRFERASFAEVARELERWYDLQVELRGSPAEVLHLNAAFTDQPLSEVLNVIARTLNLDYDRHGRRIVFYPTRRYSER